MSVYITCPLCKHEAPLYLFERVNGTQLGCKRCRSKFNDPNAYKPDATYADCDFRKPAYRFPFHMDGNNSIVTVRNGYNAIIVGNDGRERWLTTGEYKIGDMASGFQLYYICLKPRILWGTKGVEEFGAYGSATLSVSSEFAESCYAKDKNILRLEDRLKKMVDWCVTAFVRNEISQGNTALLERRTFYENTLGVLTEGVSMIQIELGGYRNARGETGFFPFSGYPSAHEEEDASPEINLPVEYMRIPGNDYTVKPGHEDVLVTLTGKRERHKAGDRIETVRLRNARKLYRFHSKQFEFPFGWGIFNNKLPSGKFFSANGTLSFYVDNTEIMSGYLETTKNWKEFEAQFFTGVIKPEISAAMGEIISEYIGSRGMGPLNVRKYLSEMSIDLTNVLNGENVNGGEPVFRKYGLRVNRADIMGIDLYCDRR